MELIEENAFATAFINHQYKHTKTPVIKQQAHLDSQSIHLSM